MRLLSDHLSSPPSPQGCINETQDDLETLGYALGGIAIAAGAVEVRLPAMALSPVLSRESHSQTAVWEGGGGHLVWLSLL